MPQFFDSDSAKWMDSSWVCLLLEPTLNLRTVTTSFILRKIAGGPCTQLCVVAGAEGVLAPSEATTHCSTLKALTRSEIVMNAPQSGSLRYLEVASLISSFKPPAREVVAAKLSQTSSIL